MRLGKDMPPPSDQPPQPDSRSNLNRPITVLKVGASRKPKTFFGYAKNISRGGILIGTTNPRRPGSRFRLEIPLPEPLNLVVTCNCEVVWRQRWAKGRCHEPGMGLRFLDLPEEIATAIDEWIRSQKLIHQLWH